MSNVLTIEKMIEFIDVPQLFLALGILEIEMICIKGW